jgi:hypothetical protein
MAAWIDTAFTKQALKKQGKTAAAGAPAGNALAARPSSSQAGLQLPGGSGCPPDAAAPAGTRKALQQQQANAAGCVRPSPSTTTTRSSSSSSSSSAVSPVASLRPFFSWVATQEQQGLMGFSVKA